LFDDPTSGLDPITGRTVIDEIIKLRDVEHVTSILVTHHLPDAFYVSTHEAVRREGRLLIVPADQSQDVAFILLKDGRIYFQGQAAELRASKDPYLRAFLSGWIPPLM
jgi:phospholipid/cholesterol/gamma-HCH transport system ATP-binding protein